MHKHGIRKEGLPRVVNCIMIFCCPQVNQTHGIKSHSRARVSLHCIASLNFVLDREREMERASTATRIRSENSQKKNLYQTHLRCHNTADPCCYTGCNHIVDVGLNQHTRDAIAPTIETRNRGRLFSYDGCGFCLLTFS